MDSCSASDACWQNQCSVSHHKRLPLCRGLCSECQYRGRHAKRVLANSQQLAQTLVLTISTKKTEILHQPAPGNPYIAPNITLNGHGPSLMSTNSPPLLDCIDKVWIRKGIRLQTKLKVYKAAVVSTLLYGSNTTDTSVSNGEESKNQLVLIVYYLVFGQSSPRLTGPQVQLYQKHIITLIFGHARFGVSFARETSARLLINTPKLLICNVP